MGFALLCLLSSALWHTMSGCADHRSMDICARVDYVGIGWWIPKTYLPQASSDWHRCWISRLISASVGTVVHYGFQCHPRIGHAFLGLCFVTGLAGNIFPFMAWFNQHEYRVGASIAATEQSANRRTFVRSFIEALSRRILPHHGFLCNRPIDRYVRLAHEKGHARIYWWVRLSPASLVLGG